MIGQLEAAMKALLLLLIVGAALARLGATQVSGERVAGSRWSAET